MKIEHLGLWVQDLELMRSFYLKYFDTSSGEKYVNPKTQFQSYFILFGEGKTRLEIMTRRISYLIKVSADLIWALPISLYL